MRRIRIKGIVREAEALRQALSTPMTAEQCDAMKRRAASSVRQVQTLLRQHNASLCDLPAPSRRAYAFLRQFDGSQARMVSEPDGAAPREKHAAGSTSLRGLSAFFDGLLDDIARNSSNDTIKSDATMRVIQQTAERIEHDMQRTAIEPEHLTAASRRILGWFRYFADPQTFGAYLDALQRAGVALAPLAHQPHYVTPLLIHFRASRHLYRCRVFRHGTRIVLNAPMIAFDRDTFSKLSRYILGDKTGRRAIMEAQLSESYQAVLAGFEAAQGVVQQTAGMTHDLVASFKRVNARYFGGHLSQPKLAWIGQLTGRVFGHYDVVHDRLSISSTLDRPDVPEFVLDHVMHHELLHKKHGTKWHNGRRHGHTPSFRREERAFDGFLEANRFLNQIG